MRYPLNYLSLSLLLCVVLLAGCGSRNPDETARPVAPATSAPEITEPEPATPEPPKPNSETLKPETQSSANVMAQEEFCQAALDGDRDKVHRALDNGTPVNVPDESGKTPLMLAAFNGHIDVVRMLLQAGAKLSARDDMGRTPLMFACTGPYAETVSLLLDKGAQFNVKDSHEAWTPLMFAAAEGHTPVVQLLLDAGADPTMTDSDEDTAANFAVQRGHAELAELLRKAEKAYASKRQ